MLSSLDVVTQAIRARQGVEAVYALEGLIAAAYELGLAVQ